MPALCDGDCFNASIELLRSFTTQGNYAPYLIPSTNGDTPLVIYLAFALVKILSLDNSGILSVAGMVTIYWSDSRLTWQPEEFSGLKNLQVPREKVWTPSLNLLNPASSVVSIPIDTKIAWIYHNGYILSPAMISFATACTMDLRQFPYDTQTCDIHFTDVNYWAGTLTYQPHSPTVSLDLYRSTDEWTVVNTSLRNTTRLLTTVVGEVNEYSILQVTLQLKRNSLYYSVTLVFPTILLLVLMQSVYLLPCGSVLKVTLSASLVLTMYVLQKDSTRMLPSFADSKYPRIVVGLCIGMVLGAFTLVVSVLSLTLSQLQSEAPRFLLPKTIQPRSDADSLSENADEQQTTSESMYMEEVQTTEVNKYSAAYLKELIKLAQAQAKEGRLRKLEQQRKQRNKLAWQRVEFFLNVFCGVTYLVTAISCIFLCLIL